VVCCYSRCSGWAEANAGTRAQNGCWQITMQAERERDGVQ